MSSLRRELSNSSTRRSSPVKQRPLWRSSSKRQDRRESNDTQHTSDLSTSLSKLSLDDRSRFADQTYQDKLKLASILPVRDLINLCSVSKDHSKLCNDELVWKENFDYYFGRYMYKAKLMEWKGTRTWYQCFKELWNDRVYDVIGELADGIYEQSYTEVNELIVWELEYNIYPSRGKSKASYDIAVVRNKRVVAGLPGIYRMVYSIDKPYTVLISLNKKYYELIDPTKLRSIYRAELTDKAITDTIKSTVVKHTLYMKQSKISKYLTGKHILMTLFIEVVEKFINRKISSTIYNRYYLESILDVLCNTSTKKLSTYIDEYYSNLVKNKQFSKYDKFLYANLSKPLDLVEAIKEMIRVRSTDFDINGNVLYAIPLGYEGEVIEPVKLGLDKIDINTLDEADSIRLTEEIRGLFDDHIEHIALSIRGSFNDEYYYYISETLSNRLSEFI